MMKLLYIAAISIVGSSSAFAKEIIHYKNVPVTITLTEGEERSIEFGDHVQVGMTKGQQEGDLFRVQSAQGFIHIKPNKVFTTQRVQIKRITDGRVILLDLVSSPKSQDSLANLEPVQILLDEENIAGGQTIETIEEGKSSLPEEPSITPVELVRYASQRLYGPTRLHHDVRGIIDTPLGLKESIRVFKGEAKYKTVSTPIVAYRGGAYYLAGIYIKNTSAEKLQLDYLDLNLPFHTATFQHHTLESNGVPGDSTILYLVSEEPLKNILQPWTYYHDLREAERARLAELEK
tara:strand:+ start:39029 stop:39901 length:873 start_codon:yes stop_codon:yes gene_type:complete